MDQIYTFLVVSEKILINVLLLTITAWVIYAGFIKKDDKKKDGEK
jgi:putative Mn2+ efflux pump MntP